MINLPNTNEYIINIFGDICLEEIKYKDFRYGQKLENKMKNAFNIGNLECVLTNSKVTKELQAHILRPDCKDAPYYLKPFNILSLANNHIQDFLNKGCEDTMDFLNNLNIRYFGIGKSFYEAIKPICFNLGTNKIAIIGATRYANSKNSNYGTSPEKLSILKSIIMNLKVQGYMVWLYFHWGYLYQRIPSPRERKIAHKCIDYGADLIIGAHPHVFQSHEIYNNKEIWYSLGNFIFHPNVTQYLAEKSCDDRLLNSFFLQITISDSKILSIHPIFYTINEDGVEIMKEEKISIYNEKLASISKPLRSSYFTYWRSYYKQASKIAKQSKKMRVKFQLKGNRNLKSFIKVYTDFNFQDIKNRLAALLPIQ